MAAPLTAAAQIQITKLNDLAFGTAVAGTTALVLPTDTRAARFSVSAPRNAQVQVTFTLPTELTRGARSVPITFDAASGRWSLVDQVAAAVAFDPRQPLTVRVLPNRNLYLWLGGTLPIPRNASSADYSAIITLTVTQQ